MLDKASYTPLYIQVREYILNRIRMGDYKVGDRLPTEKELMEQLQVGRATVRAALNELEHEGQVEKRHGIGTFVKEPKRELGFEPLISLSHYLDKMGIRCVNRVVKDEPVTVEASANAGRPVGWCAASSVCAMAKKSRWLWRITTLHRSFMNALPGARRARPRLRM